MIKIGYLGLIMALFSCQQPIENTIKPVEVSMPWHAEAILPKLTSGAGNLYLSWVDTTSADQAKLLFSTLTEDQWGPTQVLASGNNWFINWADYPTISVNNTHIMSTYLHQPGRKKMAYDIHYNVRPVGKELPKEYRLLNQDFTATEHGFVSLIPAKDSTFFVTWLDGRNMASGSHDMHGHAGGHHADGGAMHVRVAEISNQGEIIQEQVVDEMACTCCQTTTSLTKAGPVVMYRDCTEDNIRDIVIVRQVNGEWTKPVAIHQDNWMIEGCPVNGPQSDALEDKLVVAWYTGSQNLPKVQIVFSDNGGEDFNQPILVSDQEVLGRVAVRLLDSQQAIVSWMESKGEETFLYAQVITATGKRGPKIVVTPISSNRKTGFPQMEKFGDRVYFTWVDLLHAKPSLKMAYYPLAGFLNEEL